MALVNNHIVDPQGLEFQSSGGISGFLHAEAGADQTNYWILPNKTGKINVQDVQYVRKGTAETRSSTTTLADDTTLEFNVVNGQTYYLDIRIIWTGTGGIKWGLIGPAELVAPSLATSWLELTAGNMPLDNSAGNANIIFRTGAIKATGTGTVVFQWCQNSSDPAGTTLDASTAIELRKVS